MKNLISYPFVLLLVCGVLSCGPKAEEAKNAASVLSNLDKVTDAVNDAQNKVEQRRAKGDTLAIPHQDLQKYLPNISGYQKDGEPDGESVNMMGASFSKTSQKYKKGDLEAEVTIVDYNGAYAMYGAATAIWAMGLSVDNKEETTKGVEISGAKGMETFKKGSKKATVVLGIAERFLITIDAENQTDTEFVKEIAKSIDVSALSKM